MTLLLDLEANVEFALLEGFILAGTISDIKLTVVDMKAYFATDVSIADIQAKVQALSEPLETIMNSQLAGGWGLPIPRHISQEISKTRVFNYDHFIMVESDPQIEARLVKMADIGVEKL